MDRALLDTDIFSEVLKGVDQSLIARAAAYRATWNRYSISVLTVLEIVKGLHKVHRESEIAQFLSGLPNVELLNLDWQTAALAGRIYADLERTGQTIGRADPMIAATALQHGMTLVTGNQAHFRRIVTLGYKLRLENWRNH
jgi:tRNA(fMet)-specific endonuclease VapC